jgi:hypothetical protein|tara:strand:- start:47 stop:340 length:294 start_codon:yes stop_codon:yes gene_type:complete
MMDVKLIRMITGEEIVAEVVDFVNGILTIKNALVVVPQQGQIGFAPWATVISLDHPDIALDIKHVIYSVEVQPEVVQQYAKIFGGPDIITPNKQLIL